MKATKGGRKYKHRAIFLAGAALALFFLLTWCQNIIPSRNLTGLEDKRQLVLTDSPHKSLFPLTWREYVAVVLVFCGSFVSAGSGIGGGGIFISIFILLLGFTITQAVPLGNATVLGGAIANASLNWKKRNPAADRPLIEYDIIFMMEPPTLIGVLLGSFLNQVLPGEVLVVGLLVTLALVAQRTIRKGVALYRLENESRGLLKSIELATEEEESAASDDLETTESATQQLQKSGNGNTPSPLPPVKSAASKTSNNSTTQLVTNQKELVEAAQWEQRLRALVAEERRAPRGELALLTLLLAVLFGLDAVKGTAHVKSTTGVERGSAAYWLVVLAMLLVVGAYFLRARRRVLRRELVRARAGCPWREGDVRWGEGRRALVFPLLCTGAGVVAGLFGLGGGVIKAPLLLEMGVPPGVAAATCAAMVLFTSASAFCSFALFGAVRWGYAAGAAALGLAATLAGQAAVLGAAERRGRPSVIVLCVGAVLVLSALAIAAHSAVAGV
mmetsp:Transcript_21760/g.34899  ORF Transcript_21760/g.34899 Transcript_21760/m.34899 type:complete len:501 (-) Transcript_21760:82-1584(-)